ncbi:MAG: DUF4292 domain-containing protein [Muribaculaceae bacterium]|nr:DUF4292 domain-containing protein [Muribaculaceae bacterium]
MTLRHCIPAILIAACAILAPGCRSKKSASAEHQQSTAVVNESAKDGTSATWSSLYAPVSLDIMQPVQFSTSGRGQMVRGQSIWLSMRMIGMEVGSAVATPDMAVVAVKMPRKMKLEVPLVDFLNRAGASFELVQEALLGNEEALSRLPQSVSYRTESTDTRSMVELYTTYAGKPLSLRLTWNLGAAEWDSKPRSFNLPGADYSTVTINQVLGLLGK